MPSATSSNQHLWINYDKLYIIGDNEGHSSMVKEIQFEPDGTVWMGSQWGLLKLDSISGRWQRFNDGSPRSINGSVRDFRRAPDGSWWIGTEAGPPLVYHFIPGQAGLPDIWHLYDERDGMPANDRSNTDRVNGIAVQSNDVIWIATNDAATRCDFGKR